MLKKLAVICSIVLCLAIGQAQNAGYIFLTSNGQISFKSEAPQELIKANSNELKGALDANSKTFTFKVRIQSFSGFNSGMQQTHFNENYLESETFPEATFKGKIIEDVDFSKPGKQQVRAKGIMTMHGVEQERIIKAELTILPDNNLKIEAAFSLLLSDYKIPIPRVVKEKLAEEIKVNIQATLKLRSQ